MAYRVLTDFSDMLDNGYIYRTGDSFPRSGLSVSEQRIRDLASASNRLGEPMIEVVPEDHVEVGAVEVAEAVEETEKVAKPKRGRKKKE